MKTSPQTPNEDYNIYEEFIKDFAIGMGIMLIFFTGIYIGVLI